MLVSVGAAPAKTQALPLPSRGTQGLGGVSGATGPLAHGVGAAGQS